MDDSQSSESSDAESYYSNGSSYYDSTDMDLDENDDAKEKNDSCSKGQSDDTTTNCQIHVSDDYYSGDERLGKRIKTEITEKEDRISTLPDTILIHIMSFLPMEDAVKTGILSRRWPYLWTQVQNLTFTYKGIYFKRMRNFIDFINRTLIFHKGCNVKKFVVDFNSRFQNSGFLSSHVNTWIHFATEANVDELGLLLYDFILYNDLLHYLVPQHLYRNSTITKLTLEMCTLKPCGLIRWKSLKYLSIRHSKLSRDLVRTILEGSPVLEFLELQLIRVKQVDINSVSLKKLVMDNCYNYRSSRNGFPLEISAPNLQSLGLSGMVTSFKLIHIQNLVDCNLSTRLEIEDHENGYEVCHNALRENLHSIQHVKRLTIGIWWLQILSVLELKGVVLPTFKCECLILERIMKECDFPGIAGLLQNSPNLQTLVIDMTTSCNEKYYEFDFKVPDNYWTCRKESLNEDLLLQNLKTVKIVNFVTGDCVLELVRFFLEKSRVLEKMIINAKRDELLQLDQLHLLSLPRSSPHALVIFSELFSVV